MRFRPTLAPVVTMDHDGCDDDRSLRLHVGQTLLELVEPGTDGAPDVVWLTVALDLYDSRFALDLGHHADDRLVASVRLRSTAVGVPGHGDCLAGSAEYDAVVLHHRIPGLDLSDGPGVAERFDARLQDALAPILQAHWAPALARVAELLPAPEFANIERYDGAPFDVTTVDVTRSEQRVTLFARLEPRFE